MSSKLKNTDRMKNLMKSSAEDSNKSLFTRDINMSHIQGDTDIRFIDVTSLIPAPSEWNFFTPLTDSKMFELIESILSKGLLHPIVVWEREDSTYMILSGHNRVKAYEYILKSTQDETFKKIPAFIKGENAITEDEAKEIIIDTNWVQRVLSPLEKSRSIATKYAVLRSKSHYKSAYNKYGDGKIRDKIAEEYKISGRQITELERLNKLIEPFKDKLYQNSISYSAGAKIALFDESIQQWLFDHYVDKMTSKYTRRFKGSLTQKQLEDILSQESTQEYKKISIEISSDVAELFENLSMLEKNKLSLKIEKLIESAKETLSN
ncbi:ParB/RepB/Spo0J family partition protein [Anoxynatronum sibiricum]|uniref:ParB N-terminal domain-containing protein n=1 Tax=Anoxynatronum sibiricum TaxID=210623 RepID=A0ABU9VX30_9CLOT